MYVPLSSVSLVRLLSADESETTGVASERCREMNAVLSKAGAYVVLRTLLGLEVDLDKVPDGLLEEGGAPVGVETVVPAVEVPPRGRTKVEVIEVRRDIKG